MTNFSQLLAAAGSWPWTVARRSPSPVDASPGLACLRAALDLAQEIGLPGEAWPILGELGKLYLEQGGVMQVAGHIGRRMHL